MPKDIVVIGCRLPHGIVLHDPTDPKLTVTLAGLNKAQIIGGAGLTQVPSDFWDKWNAVHSQEPVFPALESGAIYMAKSLGDAEAIAREYAKRKTGFEPMPQDGHGIKKATPD